MKIDVVLLFGDITPTARKSILKTLEYAIEILPDAFWDGISHQCSRKQG